MAFSLNMGLDGAFDASINVNGQTLNIGAGKSMNDFYSQHSLLFKERWLAYNALYKNIGNRQYKPTTFGTVIGYPSVIQYGNRWAFYNTDQQRANSSDYIEYINQNFFTDNSVFPNGFLDSEERIGSLTPQNLSSDKNHVGVIHYYNWNTSNPNNGDNGDSDTYLGTWNTKFLNNALHTTLLNEVKAKRDKYRISNGVYSGFGISGETLGTTAMTDGDLFNGKAHRIKKSIFSEQSEVIKFAKDYSKSIDAVEKEFYETLSKTTKAYVNASKKGYNLDELTDELLNDTDFYKPTDYLQRFVKLKKRRLKDTSNQYDSNLYYNDTKSSIIGGQNNNKVNEYGRNLNVVSSNVDEEDVSFTYVFRNLVSKNNNSILNAGYNFGDIGNNLYNGNDLFLYAENSIKSKNGISQFNVDDYNNSDYTIGTMAHYTPLTSEGQTDNYNDIIHFTNRQFLGGYYDTLVARFATKEDNGNVKPTDTQTAVTERWGMSHGRNLLKRIDKRKEKTNGYSNPYCRVWTYHHQYNAYNKLIRPFVDGNNTEDELLLNNDGYKINRTAKGLARFKEYGTRDRKTGLIRIAPTEKTSKSDELKKLMFSIENLAWKEEQTALMDRGVERGPNQGRIMWFPPYNLKFDESVNVRWNPTSFIGRGEDIYTYTGTERSGSLSFTVLIDHPSIINQWRGMTSSDDSVNDVDGDSIEQGILRFFAGCDVLYPKLPPQIEQPPITPPLPQIEQPPITPPLPQESPTPPSPISNEFTFNVFFPNNYTGIDDNKGISINPIEYLLNGLGAQSQLVDGKVIDLPTTMGQLCIGYEVHDDNGISSMFPPSSTKTVTPYQQATSTTTYLTSSITLVTQVSNKPRKCESKYNNWGYRVDTSTKSTKMCGQETNVSQEKLLHMNYLDSKSNKLNASGYETAYCTGGFIDKPSELYSLADVYCALKGIPSIWTKDKEYVSDRVDNLKTLLNDSSVTITEIEYVGNASSDGYSEINRTLSKQRADTIRKWFESCGAITKKFSENIKHTTSFNGSTKDKHVGNNVSSLLSKVWRSTTVKVKYSSMNVSNANLTTNALDSSVGLVGDKVQDIANEIKDDIDVVKSARVVESEQRYTEIEDKLTDRLRASYKSYENDFEGYGNEYKFFSELAASDSIFRNKIVEKIKYFDPAFHSISPEGFNSRLTFLHQCTRAGNTKRYTDVSSDGNATNLAFGTPPVCILKIGDFIHTKIIIDSLNISYDDSSWDLNSEGIGVMPMMANVNMSFKYIGSQSLSGPISRLGNALSFNYYANTELYDGRSEIEG